MSFGALGVGFNHLGAACGRTLQNNLPTADDVAPSWFANFTQYVYSYDANLIYDYVFPLADGSQSSWFCDFTQSKYRYDPDIVLPTADGRRPTVYADFAGGIWRAP